MRRLERIELEVESVAKALGVKLSMLRSDSLDNYDYKIRVVGIDQPKGFSLLLGDDYLSWSIAVKLDEFGGALLAAMQNRFEQRITSIGAYYEVAAQRSTTCTFAVNGEPLSKISFNEPWDRLVLEIQKDFASDSDSFAGLNQILLDSLCILLCLLVEDEDWLGQSGTFHKEGGQSQVLSTKYERSRYNRAICLQYYGFQCHGCGLLMSDIYGPLGEQVIHVHHLTPVSQMGTSYRVNPLTDLVPLCPNCHNVIHRQDPPLSLRELIATTGNTFTPSPRHQSFS